MKFPASRIPARALRLFSSPSVLALRLRVVPFLSVISAVLIIFPDACPAQVNYLARFAPEKESFLRGEPIFCDFVLQNTGTRTFTFSYRSPNRVLNRELEQEPRFVATSETGSSLPDPAPRPCGGAKGAVVYGSVTLPPGQTHTERWLLNQWARISSPGRYRVRAERRLPLFALDSSDQKAGEHPAAFAMAINELTFEVLPSTDAQLDAVFQPYLKILNEGTDSDFPVAALVVTTLPRPSLLPELEALAGSRADERRWDRKQALEGLARLGTRPAWEAISKIARGESLRGRPPGKTSTPSADDSLRAYAVLLLGEKADPAFLPALLKMTSTASQDLRGDVLRALGFFHHPRANQVLFEKLHSPNLADRVNAILGLKNLESKDAIPALLAMLNDPEAQVRQVAHFALESLTGIKLQLSQKASRPESAQVAEQWHAWWREKGASFIPIHQSPCHDW